MAETNDTPPDLHALRARLALPADQPLDEARCLQLLVLLIDLATALHQLTWQTWKTIAPDSPVRRAGSLQALLGQFLAARPDAPPEQVAAELAKLRQLIASLISAVSQVGQQFANAYLTRFNPTEIEVAAAAEKAGWFGGGKDSRCWRKYMELAEALNEEAIDTEIRQVVARYAEQLMKGLGH